VVQVPLFEISFPYETKDETQTDEKTPTESYEEIIDEIKKDTEKLASIIDQASDSLSKWFDS